MQAIVAYPALSDADARRIEAMRAVHDPSAVRIAAHFTLVFPVAAVAEGKLRKRMDTVAEAMPPFAVALKRILVHQEGESYLYLVPDEGYDALMGLYERLNPDAGSTASFTPHVTIGRLAARDEARTIATGLAAQRLAASGRITALTLVAVPESGPVTALRTAPLRG